MRSNQHWHNLTLVTAVMERRLHNLAVQFQKKNPMQIMVNDGIGLCQCLSLHNVGVR